MPDDRMYTPYTFLKTFSLQLNSFESSEVKHFVWYGSTLHKNKSMIYIVNAYNL